MIDTRSNAERHRDAASRLRSAIRNLRDAAKDEGDLEWSGALAEIIEQTEHVRAKLIEYAERDGAHVS